MSSPARSGARRILPALLLFVLVACGAGAAGSGHARDPRPAGVASGIPARIPDGDWTTFDFNAQRTGVGPASTGITAGDLHALRRQVVTLDGTVDSSPIQLHGIRIGGHRHDVIVLTTTYGRTIALNAATGRRLWQYTPSDIGSYEGSYRITTATPVADADRRYVYAASPDGVVHKLKITTGHQVWATSVTRDATHEKLAAALSISGRSVVVTTGGYIGDAPPYQGHIVLIDRASGHITEVWNTLCSHQRHLIRPPSCPASDSAIWGRAGAVVEPHSGDFLLATGNAPFNGSTDWGDSVIELSPTLGPLGHWTPKNQAQLNVTDTDLGSTAPALLPGGLALQGGKAGVMDLLALGRLSGMTGQAGRHLGGALQQISSPGGNEIFSAPAVWQHSGQTYVFVSTPETCAYVLRHRRLHGAWCTGSGGTSPVVAGGLLYVYDPAAGQLNVYRPRTGHRLASLPAASGHWNSPIVIGGRIVLPVGDANNHSTSGQLYIWRLAGR